MFRSIVVPLDGSSLAACAIPYAALVAAPGARITLIGAVEPPINDLFTLSRSQEIVDEMSFCREILSREVEARAAPLRAQGFDVVTTVPTGGAIGAIIGCAHDGHADLIVMATHGSGGPARWAFGSVTNSVLHNTTVPTLVVRATADDRPARAKVDGIIVPLDGSPTAEEAVPVAHDLAIGLALPLQIVRVIGDAASRAYRNPLADEAAVQRLSASLAQARINAEHAVEAIIARLNGAAVRATGTVSTGDPAAVLSEYLRERPHSLVVMASRGEHEPQHWLFGNIAEKIVATAPNPTLVVHPATRAAPFMHVDPALAARYPD
jgi:nucleotide-binding universal stress UspA family protein